MNRYVDVMLPACTGFERCDIQNWTGNNPMVVATGGIGTGGIPPQFESKNDIAIYSDLAKKLGIEQEFNEGNTDEDWCKKTYASTNMPITYDELKTKGYYVWQQSKEYLANPETAWRWYYDKPEGEGLVTPSGKIEIFSQVLFQHYGVDDPDMPAIPKYIESWEGRGSTLTPKYPLQLITPHPKYRFHNQYDEVSWMREIYKIVGPDGEEHEPMRIHPTDAQARGISDGDIVRVFNDRAQILCGAKVTEGEMPGTISISYGVSAKLKDYADRYSLDTAGQSNFLTKAQPGSKHAMVCSYNALVQVEKWGK
jgi:anaerobic selenocysteine-containing dehydrogenase